MNSLEEIEEKYDVTKHRILLDEKQQVYVSVKVVSNKNLNQTPIMIIPGGPGGDCSFFTTMLSYSLIKDLLSFSIREELVRVINIF